MKKNSLIGRSASFFLSMFILSIVLISCDNEDSDAVKPKTIADMILESGDFTIFKEIMRAGEMTDALRTENLTFLAPNDAAFKRSGISDASAITSQTKDSIRSFVNYHMLAGRIEAANLKVGPQKAINQELVYITKKDSTITINKADILLKNVNADNGIIHVIGRTLTDK